MPIDTTGGTGGASGDVGDTKKERFCRKWQNYVSPDSLCQTSGKADPMLTVFKEKLPAPARHFHPNCQAFLTQDRPVFAANAAKAPSCVLFTQAADVAASCSGRQVRAQLVPWISSLRVLAATKSSQLHHFGRR
ncbi:hypothetical protein [Leisingera sp. ANG-S5]|uniref:hypothetical protein n=1 Tax=Leisingera sp. ANG-S5 TaxID=1577901 RepID=UPI00126A18CE|nr:hypothetical protein [Leisingera sp. ANG-S5]